MAGTVGANQANSAAHQAAGQESTFDISKLVAEAITKASSSTSTVPQTQANLTPKMVQLRFDSTPVHINGQNTSPGATTYREPREEGELTDSDDKYLKLIDDILKLSDHRIEFIQNLVSQLLRFPH